MRPAPPVAVPTHPRRPRLAVLPFVHVVNSSLSEPTRGAHPRQSAADRFEAAFGRCDATLRRAPYADLAPDELTLLDRLAGDPDGVALTWLAAHLGRPKSTTSVLVKDLERRGFVRRTRRADDERRLEIGLTATGQARVAAARLLDPDRLAAALRALSPAGRTQLLDGIEALARAAEQLPIDGSE
jgi:DNA-binding MarR family transcriptional regulator